MKDSEIQNLEIELLIQAIYARYQYDFRLYSRASLRRRLEQAMIRFHCPTISDLQAKLMHGSDFFTQLLSYLTVNTTEMFRDPEYFLALKEKVFPVLKTYPSIKIWVAGCSTGEEVISLSILLEEAGLTKYLLYATDINPSNLDAAKRSIYSSEAIQSASRSYHLAGGNRSLSDYYSAAYDAVKFSSHLLKKVVFSDHSLSTDNVFSEMHFISCRNVLIYFDRKLQERVFKLFNDSLVRNGFLGLGNKESMLFTSVKSNFEVIDGESKIYQKIHEAAS